MLKENISKYLIYILIVFGFILRFTVFCVSPPNNAYDDHLEVINIYAQDFSRPATFQCWECYQPPLYYYTGAIVLNISRAFGGSQTTCWKMVQAINPLLSVILLFIAYQIFLLLKIQKFIIAIILSFIAILPRDIFTSVMIGNDYMVVFFTVLAFYLFLKTLNALKKGNKVWVLFSLLVLTVTLGSLTKQHGLLLHLFTGVIFIVLCRKAYRKSLIWALPILLIGVFASLSDEVWKYSQTGEFLVSNQDHFNYAVNQYPGALKKVEFFSFRIFDLYENPFISKNTSASFFTEIFARIFYDYEWRFISPKISWAKKLGYIGYSIGLAWGAYFIFIIISWMRKQGKNIFRFELFSAASKYTPIIVAILFMFVPLLQTFRYPYFSSMKAMFMLSAIMLILLVFGRLAKGSLLIKRLGIVMIVLNVTYGIILVKSIAIYMEFSLNHLHGPLWPIP